MNGAHDMGGGHGFGPVVAEVDEPVFHTRWEARAWAVAMTAGAAGGWNIDQSRFAREDTPPADYLSRSYYEMWLYGLEKLLIEHGLISGDEIARAMAGATFEPIATPALKADRVVSALTSRYSNKHDIDLAPKFVPGQRVRAKSSAPRTHTRLPRYVRGHTGVIDRDHGIFTLPDTNSLRQGESPQHVYAVRFEAEELWGADSQGGAVYVDLWDDYLEPAP